MIGKKILHYKIIEKLGEGGMGVVYKAEDTKLKREVAIKFLPPQIAANSDERKRFEIEAQAAAALNHPNIATIHAIEHVEDQTFLVMEYIDGQELKEKVRAGPLPIPEALNLGMQIAKGLQAAHKKGIVHRDIKATNIMLAEDGHVKIMDFGLAKFAGKSMVTKAGTTLGTAAYMSPEQARAVTADHRSDLWSFGVVLYEMLTGELPLKAEHDAAWSYVILNEQPKTPSAINNIIPLPLDAVVMKLLEKNREHRYQTAEEVLHSLRDALAEKKVKKDEDDSKSIAVLPFQNISPEKETDYFSDGLTEELIANLSKLKNMKVIARTTSMQYKGTKKDIKTIGHELKARHLIEGSVRRFQENLRITAQLIEVESGTQLWAETYKGKMDDVFDIKEEVSKQIVEALMLELTSEEKIKLTKRPTVNPEAFDYYLRARDFLYNRTKNNVHFAIQLFEQAIELDPRFAAAFAGLGEAYGAIYRDFDRKESWLDKALEAGLKALMYDSSLSEAYAALGLAYFGKNSLDEALTASRRAIELNPNNFNAYWILARIYHTTDKDLQAVEALERIVEINPDFLQVYDDLRMIYERLNDKEKFDRTIQTMLAVYPRYLSQHPEDLYRRLAYAVALAGAGRNDEAKSEGEKALQLSPEDPIIISYCACLYSRLKDKQRAVELLKKAVSAGYENYEWIKRDPDFENIRNEPGYIELMKGK